MKFGICNYITARCGLRTPPAHANVLTVPRTNTRLSDRSFVGCGSENLEQSIPASLRQPDIEFGQFK